MVFGDRASIADARFGQDLTARWPAAAIIGCSTAGQICGTEVSDTGVVATAVHFEHTVVQAATAPVTAGDSAAAGVALARTLAGPDLVHVLVISEGLDINGEALVRGLGEHLPASVSVTGGLSADGELFKETVEEEVEGVRDIVGPGAAIAGFYSYGEISPLTPKARCELHNQTMTVTTLSER